MKRNKFGIQLFSLSADALKIDKSKIVSAMGYGQSNGEFLFAGLLDELLAQAPSHLKIQAGFRIFPRGDAHATGHTIRLQQTDFKTGQLLAARLKKIEAVAIFTASAGATFDAWLHDLFSAGDPASGYIADLIGSEFVEAAADWIEEKIGGIAREAGFGCSNRYSPGYCGWDVAEQHKLFAFLPSDFCDIKLTDAALMQPIKSVSGIIGIGRGMTRKAYHCSLCDLQDCYKRRSHSIA